MKKIHILHSFWVLLLFNSCMTDRESENSFYLNQINRIQLISSKTIFFTENLQEDLNLTVSFFDRDNRPFLNNIDVPYVIYLGDSVIKKPKLDLARPGKYNLRVMFPTREHTFSNEVELEVVTGDYISELVLDFSTETRNEFTLANKEPYDFTLRAIGPNGEIPGVADQMLRNLNLKVGNTNATRLTNVVIDQLGLLEVQASVFGVNSNILKINSREDISYPIKEFQVVFHVFSNIYSPTTAQFENEINNANLAFGGGVRTSFRRNLNAVDTGFRFKLADKNPDGSLMETKGVNRIITDQVFQDAEDDELYILKFNSMWDPNQYINVFIEDLSSIDALGYAFLPFLTEPIVGGLVGNFPPETELFYPISITLDKKLFDGQVNLKDALSHEIGHYLGLRHTFQDCQTGDYCEDTPSHVRPSNPSIAWSNNRMNCSNAPFISTNFMDYVITWDNFTFDQKERMVKVYENALFMPKDFNAPDARLKPFMRGQLDPSIKPIICNF
ncbi:M43 family zinc metalloprotease [Cognataquiflexum rubidum]|uniref:M43 family zinc metalloprotease n=1 Tax=Cognataquiflexum rubidum TaxID=2922273 RepID=UPI001F1291A4|nr:M43 family zinc metalloprotease [Cognataquiflexum rubidum]MCH6234693.1 M43 family zinc metalloprotease [Cognataquiflexum rubidum]